MHLALQLAVSFKDDSVQMWLRLSYGSTSVTNEGAVPSALPTVVMPLLTIGTMLVAHRRVAGTWKIPLQWPNQRPTTAWTPSANLPFADR